MFVVLLLIVLAQDLLNIVSIPLLFYFWILFLLSRVPQVILLLNVDVAEIATTSNIFHIVNLVLAILGTALECWPLRLAEKTEPSPEEECSHASNLFYGWLDHLFWKGLKSPLLKEEIPTLCETFSVRNILEKFNQGFNRRHSLTESVDAEYQELVKRKQDNLKKRSIAVSLTKSFGSTFLIASFMKLVQDLLKFVIPQLLKALINFVDKTSFGSDCGTAPWVGYFYAISIFGIGIFQSILLQAYWKITYSVALRVRTVLFSQIYQKTLNMSLVSRKEYTVGEIVTLMSSDAQTFKQVIPSLNKVWSMPLQIILAIYFLYQELGLSVFGGVFILVLLIPFNTYMGKKSQSVNRNQMEAKGTRLRRMYELLNSIKLIKLYAWERIFEQRVNKCRETEITFLRKNAILKAIINFVFGSAPILVTLVSFSIYVSIDSNNVLTPEKAFVCLTLFSMLRLPMKLLPNILTEIFRLNVSIARVNAFLNCADIKEYVCTSSNENIDIQIKDGAFAWNEGPASLHDINLFVKSGTFHVIAGPTASGKTSLLSSMLGQMTKKLGEIKIASKSMAYVSQEAWIQNKTIKDNIIFGKAFDSLLYRLVLRACALEEDLILLPEGDLTMVGDNGVNLSGGQKQRIALARAVYSKADIYLLDDCLSAVDVHVGQQLIDQVLRERGLLGGKTRVMVTHSSDIMNIADRTSYMDSGTILRTSEQEQKKEKVEDFSEEDAAGDVITSLNDTPMKTLETVEKKSSSNKDKTQEEKSKDVQDRLKDKTVGSGSAFISSYKMYLRNFGILNMCLVLILFLLNQSLVTGSTVWLTYWSDISGNRSVLAQNKTEEFDNDFYILVYGAIGLGTATCAFVRNLHIFICAAAASRLIHSKLFQRTIKGTLSYFESTSSGSIVSRFSSDMNSVDLTIPGQMSALLFNSFEVLAVIITISLSSPIFLLAVALILVLLYGIKVFYIHTSRQVKRLESSSNAPIYAHFSETIQGISSIKAYSDEPRFVNDFEELVATNLKYSYYSIMCSRWLNLRSEMVAQILVLSASLVAVIQRDSLTPGWAGLIVSLALGITETFNCLLVALTNLEDQATVVERIKDLTEHAPQEGCWVSQTPPVPSWPERGVVEFKNYSTGYSSEDHVLRNISFKTASGEKLAIVGRTGAGKSSIALACLRILEAQEGNILIDTIDVSKLGLHELRNAVTIIPQDPVLFTGSLRENIDPTGGKLDFDIFKLLKIANLEKYDDLDLEVEEGGANFSQGEKQLVCLVRALCRGSR